MDKANNRILPGAPHWDLKPDLAHPRARNLFREDFFWDAIDDHAPWGSDEGADALMAFGKAHDSKGNPPDPIIFVQNYVGEKWIEPLSGGNLSSIELETFSAKQMEIIAIALGMYLIHGYITPDLKVLGLEAINRELQPNFLVQFGEPDERAKKLKICHDYLLLAETTSPS